MGLPAATLAGKDACCAEAEVSIAAHRAAALQQYKMFLIIFVLPPCSAPNIDDAAQFYW